MCAMFYGKPAYDGIPYLQLVLLIEVTRPAVL